MTRDAGPSEERWNVYRADDSESEFLGSAATEAEAYALAFQLGGNEIQFGLLGEAVEVPTPNPGVE